MRNFSFSCRTKILFGKDSHNLIIPELQTAGIRRVLLLTGGGSVHASGLYGKITSLLDAAGIAWQSVNGIQPNPRLEKVREAITAARAMQAQAIMPLGGGSVFDSAKAVAAGAPAEQDIWLLISKKLPITCALPIHGVLTLSGTSSELNGIGVITNDESREKFAFSSEHVVPQSAAIDPTLQYTVPPRMVLSAGLDALSHVLETYFQGEDTSPVVIEGCEALARSIIRCLRALADGQDNDGREAVTGGMQMQAGIAADGIPAVFRDYEIRSELCFCSTYAHSGWGSVGRPVRGDFSTHGISHALGALFDVTHGIAIGIIMAAWMRYIYDQGLARNIFARLATRVFKVNCESTGALNGGINAGLSAGRTKELEEQIAAVNSDLALTGVLEFRKFLTSLGLPTRLRDVQITESDIPALAELASRTLPFGCVKPMDRESITEILRLAY
ncbi:MAG: iron-containing alcohol dehydrogenase [Deltaproteobacteria bacterium]|nr:iron-containing alcohol dehydrogenase [Deltaproteobacteria bacterium]